MNVSANTTSTPVLVWTVPYDSIYVLVTSDASSGGALFLNYVDSQDSSFMGTVSSPPVDTSKLGNASITALLHAGDTISYRGPAMVFHVIRLGSSEV